MVNETPMKKFREEWDWFCDRIKMEKGKITNGQTVDENGKWVDIKEDGEYIKNPKTAKTLLPVSSGSFFGGSDYDEYYMYGITSTIETIERCLELSADWEFSYKSSW